MIASFFEEPRATYPRNDVNPFLCYNADDLPKEREVLSCMIGEIPKYMAEDWDPSHPRCMWDDLIEVILSCAEARKAKQN